MVLRALLLQLLPGSLRHALWAEVAQGRVAPYTAPMPRPVLRKVLQYYIA